MAVLHPAAFDALEREKITLKKEPFFIERNEENRKAFDAEIDELPIETDIVYVDESGIDQTYVSSFG